MSHAFWVHGLAKHRNATERPPMLGIHLQDPGNGEPDSTDGRRGTRLRDLAARLTTPLLPDDYLQLLNPLWSTRELRGRVERVIQQADDAATLVVRPGWGWTFDHRAGQYIGIGVGGGGRFPSA